MNEPSKLLSRLTSGLSLLTDKPEESAESTFKALCHLASGTRLSAVAAMRMPTQALTEQEEARLAELIELRLKGIPLAHLTGRQCFMGLEMLASPKALIPRVETELLVRTALGLLAEGIENSLVIDACTGSANVAAAIAVHRPQATVWASDLSSEAIDFAAANIRHLGLEGRVHLLQGDLLGAFDTDEFLGKVDLIICNPPYISAPRRLAMAPEIAAHEPALAFDGGALGITILQRIITEAAPFLKTGAWLAFEVGAGQGPAMARRLQASGLYSAVRSVDNEHGEVRVLAAQR